MITNDVRPQDEELAARLSPSTPVTTAAAHDLGLTDKDLTRLVATGLVRRPFKGMYLPSTVADTLETRLSVLRLVVPDDCTVTDRTAGWLWAGDRLLAPNEHLATPPVSVFCPPGRRLRNGLVVSGERGLMPPDVAVVGGLQVTTPLRTACDLGRLEPRLHGLGALDVLAGTGGFGIAELAAEAARFRGYRRVRRLRALIPWVDPRCEWPSESALRLRWYDAGLPRPECQVEVETPWGTPYLIDIGLPEERFGAEYDGVAFHGDDRREHDARRREWLTRSGGWRLVVARAGNVYGPGNDIEQKLVREYDQARRRT